MWRNRVATLAIAIVFLCALVPNVSADSFSSTNFKIDAGVAGNSLGNTQTSTNYNLVSAGGESIIGNGSGGSYLMGQGYTSQLQQSLQLTLQPSGQIGYFPFEEGVGTRAHDASASSKDAPFVGTPTWTTGKIGGGLNGFSGSNYLDTNESATYNTSAITVCAWVYLTATSTNPVAVSRSKATQDANGMWWIGYSTTTTPRVQVYLNSTVTTLTSPDPVGLSTWTHECFTYGGTDLVLYVNGEEANRTTINQALATHAYPLKIGALETGAQPFGGSIDEVKLFSRVLTAAEVRAEHDAQAKGVPSGLSLGDATPGVSKTVNYDSIVQTDAPGYSLSLSQNQNLTSGGFGATPSFSQNFDSFGHGTTLTTGNTGFDNLSATGSGTFTSSTTAPQLHSTYGRMVTTTTSTYIARESYASTTERYYRFYARTASLPAANSIIFALRGAGGTTVSGIRLDTSGTISLRDGVTAVDTSTITMAANQWMRFELYYNSTTGRQVLKLYDGDANSADATEPDEVLTGTASNGATEDFQVGIVTSQPSQTHDIDDIATSTAGWLGPVGTATIPAISSGSIATPVAWSEGSTVGLGFTLVSAPSLDGKWGSGANYAAFPGTDTTFYTRAGLLNAAKDTIAMRARLDVSNTQAPGGYQNTITVIGTSTP